MVLVGETGFVSFVVGEEATAIALGSGDVAVLGTPKVVALCEEAAVVALEGGLPEGSTTVGTHISVDHVAPTAIGATVVATAEVTGVRERSIEFAVSVTESDAVVATGLHTRAVVDRGRFLAGLK